MAAEPFQPWPYLERPIYSREGSVPYEPWPFEEWPTEARPADRQGDQGRSRAGL